MQTDPLDRRRLYAVLSTVVISIASVGLLALAPWSNWRTGFALNLINNAILLGFIVRTGDRLLARFMVFGICVGLAELPADAWLVDFTHTLDYSVGGGPMLWRSPFWMPLAWELVAVQFGYIGLLLWEKWRIGGLALTGLLGAINIPYYEEMARRIHWWRYANCKMISFTPWYIILGELLICIIIAALATRMRRTNLLGALLLGLIGGAGIFAAYFASFAAIDGLGGR